MADPVLKQLRQDLADAQVELKAATKARQKAEKEKQKAETAYNNAVVKKQQAYDNLQNAQDDLQRAESDLKTAVRDAAKTVSDLLAEAANLESTWQAQKTSFDAGKIDNFPEALGEDIDALSVNADSFSPDFDAFERAISSAKKAVSTAKANVTKADNAYAKRDAELQSANTALTQAIADEDAAQKKVDAAQDAVNNYGQKPATDPYMTINTGTYYDGAFSQTFTDALLESMRQPKDNAYIVGAQLAQSAPLAADGLRAFNDFLASGRQWPDNQTGIAMLAYKNAEYAKLGVRTPRTTSTTWVRQKQPQSDSQVLATMGLSNDEIRILEDGGFAYVTEKKKVNAIWDKGNPGCELSKAARWSGVNTYTGSAYTPMNRMLWGFERSKDTHRLNQVKKAADELLQVAVPFDRIVVRGVNDPVETVLKNLPDGALFISENFSSTSFGSGFSGYKLFIRVPAGMAGMDVHRVSAVPSENEILLPPWLTLRLIKHVNNGVICEAV